jgi:site-specific DNA-methyltransferase (adenine-specific)
MFSFAGDTVLDPFGGTGSTAVAAIAAGRNSIYLDVEPAYVAIARQNIAKAAAQHRSTGAIEAELIDLAAGTRRGVGEVSAAGRV